MNIKEKIRSRLASAKKWAKIAWKKFIPKPFFFYHMIGELMSRHEDGNFKTLLGAGFVAAASIITAVYQFPIAIDILSAIGVGSMAVPNSLEQAIPAFIITIPLYFIAEAFPIVAFVFALVGVLNVAFVYVNAIDEEIIKSKEEAVAS